MTTISLKDAQARLAETVERTEAGPVVLEDSGQPVLTQGLDDLQ